jgi:hypothetical protein
MGYLSKRILPAFFGLLLLVPVAQAAPQTGLRAAAGQLSEAGEDLIDGLLASPKNLAPVTAQMAKMRSDLALLRLQAAAGDQEDAVYLADYLLDEAERAAASRDLPRAALAINELTLAITPLQSFRAAKDRDVALLDYLGREIVLLSRLPGELRAVTLKERRAAVAGTWRRQRAGFAAIPAARATVTAMDQVVGEIQAGGKAAAQIAAGNRLLELVDELEKF